MPPKTPRLPSPQWLTFALGLFALAIRLPHLRWGLPDIEEEALPMKKAFEMWGWDGQGLTFDPQTVGWPSLSFYVHLLLQHVHYAVGRVLGEYENRYDYWLAYHLDTTQVATLARLLSAVLGAAVVFIGVAVMRRWLGWRAALVGGLLLALSPLAVQQAQMITPDILVMFFAALATHALLDLEKRGRTADYLRAAIFAGLGAASKYTPVLLTVSLYALHLRRLRSERRSLRWLGLDDRRLGFAALAALLAFCVASPFTFADLDVLRRDFSYQAMHMSRGHFGQEMREFGPWHYLRGVLAPALGWPGLCLGLLGLFAAAKQRLAPLSVFLAFFLGLGFLSTRFDRYMLPVLLPLAFGVAFAIHWATARLPQRWRNPLFVVVSLLLLVVPSRGTMLYHAQASRPSTQQRAREFLLETLPSKGTTLAIENYTVFLPYRQSEAWQQQPAFQALSETQRERFLAQPFYDYLIIPMYSARSELSAYYYDLRHYLSYDWILCSGSVRRRYERQPDRFLEQNRFYGDLERYCEVVQKFSPAARERGPEIVIYRFRAGAGEELLRERGPLAVDGWRSYADRLFAPHFFTFVDLVASQSLGKGELETADLYYAMELSACSPEERVRVLTQSAYVKMLRSDWDPARKLYRELIQLAPEDATAHGNLGMALWRLGELDPARESFRRCVALAADAHTKDWARARLAELEQSVVSED